MATRTGTTASLDDEIAAFFSLDERLVSDPYPLYRRMREEAPVYRLADKVLVSRYEDVKNVMTSPKVHQGISVRGTRYRNAEPHHAERERLRLGEMFGFFEKRVGGANGAHHRRLRMLAQRAFTPKMVATMERRIAEVADDLLAPLPHAEPIEFIDRYAFHLPLIMISEMLDISPEDRDDLRRWANSLGTFVGADWRDPEVVNEAHDSVFKLRSYLTGVFDDRRGKPTTDLLATLIAAEGEGDQFTEDELVAMIVQFVFAGHETSTMFLGNSLVQLLGDYRHHWEALCADPSLVPAATEELLRFDSPSQNLDKLAAQDMEIAGVPVAEGETITIMLGSANRDETVFENPDVVDIHRGSSHHLTFGRGPHHCLGASLARLEAHVSLRTLTRRFPDMRLATNEIAWRRTHMNRGPEVLPVVMERDRG